MFSTQFESLTVNIVRSENLKLKSNLHYITVINITIPIAISFPTKEGNQTKLDIVNSISKYHHTQSLPSSLASIRYSKYTAVNTGR